MAFSFVELRPAFAATSRNTPASAGFPHGIASSASLRSPITLPSAERCSVIAENVWPVREPLR